MIENTVSFIGMLRVSLFLCPRFLKKMSDKVTHSFMLQHKLLI